MSLRAHSTNGGPDSHDMEVDGELAGRFDDAIPPSIKTRNQKDRPFEVTYPTKKAFSGPLDLSNEILINVFETAYSRNVSSADLAVTLSVVCRRFREILLGLPRMWSVLSNHQTREQLVAFISRADAAILFHIFVNEDDLQRHLLPNRPSLDEFLDIVLSVRYFWGTINFTTIHSGYRSYDFQKVRKQLQSLALPNVLCMAFRNEASMDCDFSEVANGWDMPDLIIYTGINTRTTFLQSSMLQDLTLKLQDDGCNNWTLRDVMTTLRSTPKLTNFTLKIDIDQPLNEPVLEEEVLELEQLFKFSLYVGAKVNHYECLEIFLGALRLPCLAFFFIESKAAFVRDYTNFFHAFNLSPATCPRLLYVVVKFDNTMPGTQLINQILYKFRHVKLLYFETPSLPFPDDPSFYSDNRFEICITDLVFRKCGLLREEGVKALAEAMDLVGEKTLTSVVLLRENHSD